MSHSLHRDGRHRARVTAATVFALALPLTLAACTPDAEPSADPAESAPSEETEAPAEEVAAWEPTEDIEWIVPYSPGGGYDVYSRGIAQVLVEDGHLPEGINVVVRNVTPTPQGITEMFNADPDGYTLGILPMPAAIAQYIEFPDFARWVTEEFTVIG
ncbi:MAG: receptor, partial [Actinotalea sp.]|nr:receptor [Actinotalea sp.]